MTVTTRVADPVPQALAAEIVTLVTPAAVGIPEITPVAVFTERPAGRPEAAKLEGLEIHVDREGTAEAVIP